MYHGDIVCRLAQGAPQFLHFLRAGICLWNPERIKEMTIIKEQNDTLSSFFLMVCVGSSCSRLKRPSSQDGRWWLGVER